MPANQGSAHVSVPSIFSRTTVGPFARILPLPTAVDEHNRSRVSRFAAGARSGHRQQKNRGTQKVVRCYDPRNDIAEVVLMIVEPGASRFIDVITSVAALEAVLGRPNERVSRKVIDVLDVHCRRFIARCPFLLVASADAAGAIDVSPKGDPAGFVQVLDDKTLAIPERPGNRRADTFRNVLQNPRVGLIFLIPGKRETLRISGLAQIVRDAALRETMAVGGKLPDLALVVSVEEAFFHCAKSMIRSHLWEPEAWPSLDGLPSLAEAGVAHAKLSNSIAEIQGFIDIDERTRLY
jgi:uncharacterized protein